MKASGLLAVTCILAATSLAAGQTVTVSPLINYFSNTNSSTYSYFWTALQAANLDSYLNDTTLAITIFAPTNDAWLKRLPTLTRANGITVQELFSESKSAALQNMLQYHILNTVQKANTFKDGNYLSTLANLCSDAKTLSVNVTNNTITLMSAGGSHPKLLDLGILVGNQSQSIVYPVDDVLLPSVVTVPLSVALSNFNASSTNLYTPTIAEKQDQLSNLQSQTANEALAPVYLAPQTPPSGAPSAGTGTTVSSGSSSSGSSSAGSTPTKAPPASTTKTSPPPSSTPAATAAPSTGGVDTGVSSSSGR